MDGDSCHCTGGSDQNQPKKKKCKKAKWLSKKALQIAEKRRKAKAREEKERYPSESGEQQEEIRKHS